MLGEVGQVHARDDVPQAWMVEHILQQGPLPELLVQHLVKKLLAICVYRQKQKSTFLAFSCVLMQPLRYNAIDHETINNHD